MKDIMERPEAFCYEDSLIIHQLEYDVERLKNEKESLRKTSLELLDKRNTEIARLAAEVEHRKEEWHIQRSQIEYYQTELKKLQAELETLRAENEFLKAQLQKHLGDNYTYDWIALGGGE